MLAGHLAVARASGRLLAAAGPLTLDDLLTAATRARRFRQRTPLSAGDLAAALTAAGATPGPDGRWHPPPGTAAPARYRAIVDAAAGRDLSRQQMIDILTAAGYRPSSAAGRLSSSHPLFHRTGRNRYRIIGQPTAHH